jgi:hypothetical protein
MSISNRHGFQPLTKTSKPLGGQRLARVIAKAAKDGTYSANLTESLCVSIPFVSSDVVSEQLTALMPHLIGLIQDTQDSIISEIRKEYGRNEIDDSEISVSACIAYLDANERGNRVTSEYLSEWFKETYSLQAAEFIALACKWSETIEQLTEDQLKVIEQKTKVLGAMFAGFASGKYSPDIPKCRAMIKFGEFLGEVIDDRMSGYVVKAAKMLETKEKE